MDLQRKTHPCGDRLDKKGADQMDAPESNNCTLKLKSPLYDADDSGYGELGVNGDLSDEHRFRKRSRSQNDDVCCEVELWEPPFLGSSTPSYSDRSTQEHKYIQSPSENDNACEVLEIDLRRKHVDSVIHKERFHRSSPPFKAASSKPWYIDALLSSPNYRDWFGSQYVTSYSKDQGANNDSNCGNTSPTEKKIIPNEKQLNQLNDTSFDKENNAKCQITSSSKEVGDDCYRIIEIGKVHKTPLKISYGAEHVNEYREAGPNEANDNILHEVMDKETTRDVNNNDSLCKIDLADNKFDLDIPPHELPEMYPVLLQRGPDQDFKSCGRNSIRPYDLSSKTSEMNNKQAKIEISLGKDFEHGECHDWYQETNQIKPNQIDLKNLEDGIRCEKNYPLPSKCVPLTCDTDDEHDIYDKDEKQSDDTDTASDVENNFKLSTSSSECLPKFDPVTPPKHVKRNKRKMYTPRKSADKSDPTFRGVTMWFKTEFKNGDSDLQISACYSNVKAGCSPVTYPVCPAEQSMPDFYSYSETEGHSPYHFIKMCASCRTRRTPLWRDAEDGTPLCNACGIRYKKYRLRCSKCWHIPKKEIQTYPNCPMCGASLRYSFHNRKTW